MSTLTKLALTTLLPFAAMNLDSQSTAGVPEGMKGRANLRNVRYCEVLVAKRHGLGVVADVYSTIGLNDCPEGDWKALDAAKLKAEWKADAVILNGPRYFMMDRNALRNPGQTATFGSIEMRHLATVDVPLGNKREAYKENTVHRDTQYVYEAGKPVYKLHSQDGKTYILQSYSVEVDPTLTAEGLANLGSKLKLPKGWTFSVETPSNDLVIRTTDGLAHVLQDNLQNSYQRL